MPTSAIMVLLVSGLSRHSLPEPATSRCRPQHRSTSNTRRSNIRHSK